MPGRCHAQRSRPQDAAALVQHDHRVRLERVDHDIMLVVRQFMAAPVVKVCIIGVVDARFRGKRLVLQGHVPPFDGQGTHLFRPQQGDVQVQRYAPELLFTLLPHSGGRQARFPEARRIGQHQRADSLPCLQFRLSPGGIGQFVFRRPYSFRQRVLADHVAAFPPAFQHVVGAVVDDGVHVPQNQAELVKIQEGGFDHVGILTQAWQRLAQLVLIGDHAVGAFRLAAVAA